MVKRFAIFVFVLLFGIFLMRSFLNVVPDNLSFTELLSRLSFSSVWNDITLKTGWLEWLKILRDASSNFSADLNFGDGIFWNIVSNILRLLTNAFTSIFNFFIACLTILKGVVDYLFSIIDFIRIIIFS